MLSLAGLWRDRWAPSEFCVLPASGGDPARNDYLLLARALAQLLARCTPRGAERHFAASLKAWRALKVQLRRPGDPSLPADVINELCHEIAVHVDRSVREAALRCLRRRAQQAAVPTFA